MTERDRHSHLRLVLSEGPQTTSDSTKRSNAKDRQLSFAYPEASSVFFLDVGQLGAKEFSRILSDYIPRWIIDVRTVPRLDTLSGSRTSAFAQFERTNASYIDLFGRLGIRSYRSAEANPAFWRDALAELLKGSESRGPYLLMFDDQQLLQVAEEVLPKAIRPIVGRSAKFSQIRQAASQRTV